MEKIYVSIFGQWVPAWAGEEVDGFVPVSLDNTDLTFQLTLIEFNRVCRYAD